MTDYRMTIEGLFDSAEEKRVRFFAGESTLPPSKPFANPTHLHAGQVMTILVRRTKRTLDVLCNHLSSRAHSANRLRAQLVEYPNIQIRLLVEGNEKGPIFSNGEIDWNALRGSALVDLALDSYLAGQSLFTAEAEPQDGRIALRVLPFQSSTHFMLSDRVAYRIENDHPAGEASVNPFDPNTGKRLLTTFNGLWSLSIPARLPTLIRNRTAA